LTSVRSTFAIGCQVVELVTARRCWEWFDVLRHQTALEISDTITATATAVEMLVIHADCQRAFSSSRMRLSWSATISRRASMTAKRLSICARSVGVVGRGSSADITLLRGLVQLLVLWLALVLLVMAKVRYRRYPFDSSFCSGVPIRVCLQPPHMAVGFASSILYSMPLFGHSGLLQVKRVIIFRLLGRRLLLRLSRRLPKLRLARSSCRPPASSMFLLRFRLE
jgi:hypothetical protein